MGYIDWQKSSRCESNGCVEVKFDGNEISMRSSFDETNILRLTRTQWNEFLTGIKNEDFT